MIRFEGLTKEYVRDGRRKLVCRDVTLAIPAGRVVALLGRNGAGKSTLMRMIAGTEAPTAGRVATTGSISFPVGFAGSFHADLTGVQNTRFVARVYGVDSDALVAFVEDFAELGVHFRLPFSTYSAGMRSRLTFGVSMGIAFDTYLVDEITAVGDAAFRARSQAMFENRLSRAGAIMATHAMGQVRSLCDAAIVLEAGTLTWFDDVAAAIAQHERNLLG